METPQVLREFLETFKNQQSQPIADAALVERMTTEATTWINAVHMQYHRVTNPFVDPKAPGEEVWRQATDLHFLIVALTRLLRAVKLVTEVRHLKPKLDCLLQAFDDEVPSLTKFRNVAEHFDDYTTGKGHRQNVKRYQLQTWSLNEDSNRGLVWRWLNEEFSAEDAKAAATTLYRSFLKEVKDYLANSH